MLLVAGSAGGAILLSSRAGLPHAVPSWLRHAHAEVMSLGWFGNLTLGMAYWILPKHASGQARGRAWPMWAAYLMLNGGVLLAAGGWMPGGRGLELAAVACFAVHALPRVKPFGAGRVRS